MLARVAAGWWPGGGSPAPGIRCDPPPAACRCRASARAFSCDCPRFGQHRPRRPLLPVGRVAVLAQDALHVNPKLRPDVVADRPVVGRRCSLQFVREVQVIHPPARRVCPWNTRLTRAMACISLCPRIGLSAHIMCRLGASKPVSHIRARSRSRMSPSDRGSGWRTGQAEVGIDETAARNIALRKKRMG